MREKEFHAEIIRIKKYSWVISIVWLFVIIGSIFWNLYNRNLHLNEMAKLEAISSFNKDQAIREWASKHGDIYVPLTKSTPANPELLHIPDRNIIKPNGDTLTLLNPTNILKQMFDEFQEEYGFVGRTVSLRPLDSNNVPDKWEKDALLNFEKGEKEVFEFVEMNGENNLRLIRPMFIKKSCLKCHAIQGYKVGDISGGFSVTVSMDRIQQTDHTQKQSIALLHSLLFLVVFVGIRFGEKRFIRGIKERNKMEGEAEKKEHQYQTLFEESPVPLWEEDFSELKMNIDQLKKDGITDFIKYFDENPKKVNEFVKMVKILRINKAVVELHEANSKEELLQGLQSIFIEESVAAFVKELITIANGSAHCEFEAAVKTLDGKKKYVYLKWLVLPGYEDTLERIYISTTDITKRKQAEEEVKINKENLAIAQKIAKVGSWEWDLVSNKTTYSAELKSIYGIDENREASVDDHSQFIHKEDKPIVEEAMKLVFSDSPLQPLEYRIVLKDGTLKNILGLAERIFDDNGNLIKVLGTVQDITERAVNEAQIIKLTNAIEQSINSIMITDTKGNIEYVNKYFTELTGYSKEEVVGKNPRFLKTDYIDKSVYKNMWKTISDGNTWNGEFYNKKKNGEYFWERASISPIKDNNGKIINYVAVKEDITEWKRTEDERLHLEKLVKTSINEIYIFDKNTYKFTYLNDSALKNIGYSFEEMKQMRPFDIKPEFTLKKFRKLVEPLISGEKQYIKFQTVHQRKDKSIYPVDISLQLLEHGNEEKFTAIIIDITKRKKVEEEIIKHKEHLEELVEKRTSEISDINKQLEKEIVEKEKAEQRVFESLQKEKDLNELKDQFMSTVSHDLRTPLTAILSSVELMERFYDKLDKEQVINKYGQIKNSVSRITDMLSHVLELSRIERGKISIHFETINLKNELQTIVDEIDLLKNENHQLLYNYKLKKENHNVDINLLREILTNLLINGVKYSPNGGRVELLVDQEDKWLILQVSDEGLGISENEISSIFNDFYRTEVSQNISGSGLGLSIVKHYVEMYNGEIEVESKLGVGSVFKVKLPQSNSG